MSRILPIFDTHHHLWRGADSPAAGILADACPHQDFLWDDFRKAAHDADIDGTCLVEATRAAGEVAFAESIAIHTPSLRAMVAFAPIEASNAAAILQGLARHGLVRGVRRSTQLESDPQFILRDDFLRGARLVGKMGLLLELCVRHAQLSAVPGLARRCPDTTIVIDHLGKPDVTLAPSPEWLRSFDEIGACSNVYCKVSPVVHRYSDPQLTLELQTPFIRHVVSAVGWDRVLFGSNWPVSIAVTSYTDWVNIVLGAIHGSQSTEVNALFHDNAWRLYCPS